MSNYYKHKLTGETIEFPPYKCKICGFGDIEYTGQICNFCGWEDDSTQNHQKDIVGWCKPNEF